MRNPRQNVFDSVRLVLGSLVGAAIVALGPAAPAGADDLAAAQAAPNAAPEAAPAPLTGPQVYNAVCIACHAPPGVGGAPALGDAEAWAARLDQGVDTLIDHALNGFSSPSGLMPKKGGRLDLSDQEIIEAVEYMVEQAAR